MADAIIRRMTPSDLLLASASPRRRRLLSLLGLEYVLGATDVPEDVPDRPVDPALFAEGLAARKALAARSNSGDSVTILAADTIVVADGRILGKPRDAAHAVEMLRGLSGRSHEVLTAIAVLVPRAAEPAILTVTSKVVMRDLDDDTIAAWVERGELMGCAGAYNIEHHLASVAPTECYQNVAGLPLCHLYLLFREVAPGLPGLAPPLAPCEEVRSARCDLGRELLSSGEPPG